MSSFFSALTNPAFPFLQNALIASLLASILFGILGSVVTVKRIAGLAGAISHAVLGGIGMALYLSSTHLVPFITPMGGAIIFAILSAIIIGLVSLKAKQREDTVINAIWAIGMSIGVLFLAKTPGYTDPTSYLFGNILLVSREDLIFLAVLDVVVLFLVWRFYPQLEASAFDEEFARVRGVPTNAIFLAILGITAIAVVLLQTFVGIVMVIAMLTLPAGTAGYVARNLTAMMIFSWIFSSIFSFAGLALSWHYDLPSGAVVVVLSGAIFLGTTIVRMLVLRHQKRRGFAS